MTERHNNWMLDSQERANGLATNHAHSPFASHPPQLPISLLSRLGISGKGKKLSFVANSISCVAAWNQPFGVSMLWLRIETANLSPLVKTTFLSMFFVERFVNILLNMQKGLVPRLKFGFCDRSEENLIILMRSSSSGSYEA